MRSHVWEAIPREDVSYDPRWRCSRCLHSAISWRQPYNRSGDRVVVRHNSDGPDGYDQVLHMGGKTFSSDCDLVVVQGVMAS